jgi:hypothetical protein
MREEFGSSDEVRALVAAFEDCSLPRSAWTHRAHLTVAAWYVIWYGPDSALEHIRAGIQRYNDAHGIRQRPDGGYHETLTRFHVWSVRRHLRGATVDRSLAALVNGVVAALADRELPFRYYSKERLFSWPARTGWVEPDLRPLA